MEIPAAKLRKYEAFSNTTDWPAMSLRQKAWLARQQCMQEDLWRPPYVHRVSAKHWIESTDNQMRHGAGGPGWKLFRYNAKATELSSKGAL